MYHYRCDWCGERINTEREQYVKADVSIVTLETERYRNDRVEETEPTRFFHVTPLRSKDEWDRLGLDIEVNSDAVGDCCYTRALRAIEGHDFDEPDAGLEWRLVPVGSKIAQPNMAHREGGHSDHDSQVIPDALLDEPLWVDDPTWTNGRRYRHELDAQGLPLWHVPGQFNIIRLRDAGYETVGDVWRAVESGALLDVKGVGPKTLELLKAMLLDFFAKASGRTRAGGRVASGGGA